MKTIILSIVALTFAVACAPKGLSMGGGIKLPNCSNAVLPEKCAASPSVKAKSAKVTFNTQSLTVAPPFVCAEKGGTLEVHIVPPPAANKKGTVAVIPKNVKSAWLSGANNTDAKTIEIPISSDLADGDYDYAVFTTDDKCVDPRVHVK